jgi:hypothetical protein
VQWVEAEGALLVVPLALVLFEGGEQSLTSGMEHTQRKGTPYRINPILKTGQRHQDGVEPK